jgi:hypothetical protein
MRRKLLLLAATSIFIGAFAFACGDDDDDDAIDGTVTEVTDSLPGGDDSTPSSGGETPSAGGDLGTAAVTCPTPDPSGTPDPEATVPAGCPTPDTDDGGLDDLGTPSSGGDPLIP